jgi:DNA-binding response OmpR family regulator
MARMLVVNDESDLVSVCEVVLEEAGYEVDAFTDGRSALDLARRTYPDLVILDWIMKEPKERMCCGNSGPTQQRLKFPS